MTRSLHDAPPGAHEAVVLPRPDPAAVEFLQPEARPLLRAVGIDKAYRRGVWPARRQTRVLCGADLPDLAG
jgi:hypothetical protein